MHITIDATTIEHAKAVSNPCLRIVFFRVTSESAHVPQHPPITISGMTKRDSCTGVYQTVNLRSSVPPCAAGRRPCCAAASAPSEKNTATRRGCALLCVLCVNILENFLRARGDTHTQEKTNNSYTRKEIMLQASPRRPSSGGPPSCLTRQTPSSTPGAGAGGAAPSTARRSARPGWSPPRSTLEKDQLIEKVMLATHTTGTPMTRRLTSCLFLNCAVFAARARQRSANEGGCRVGCAAEASSGGA